MELPELLAVLLYEDSSAYIAAEETRLKLLAQANGGNIALTMYLNYFARTKQSPNSEQLKSYANQVPKSSEGHISVDLEQAATYRNEYPAGGFALALDNAWAAANQQYLTFGYRVAGQVAAGGLSNPPGYEGYKFERRMKELHGEDESNWDRAAFSQIWLNEYLAANPFSTTKAAKTSMAEGEYIIAEALSLDDEENPTTTYLTAIDGKNIKPEHMEWLWTDRFPLEAIVWLAGLPGAGKTTVMLDIAARVSAGRPFPDGAPNTLGPRRVVIAMCEDSLAKTIVPRLIAAGADMDKITFLNRVISDVEDRTMKLDSDISHLRKMLEKRPDTALLILDPMTSYFGDINISIDREVRPVTTALKRLCEECNVSLIGVIHNNKQSDANAIQKILGSSSVSGAARAVYGCSSDPEEKTKRYFTFVKGNLSAKTSGMEYTITEKILDDGIKAALISWGEATDDTAEDCLQREREVRYGKKEDKKINLAQSLIPLLLKGKGAVYSRDVYAAAEAEGVSVSAIKNALRKFFPTQVLHDKTKEGWTMRWVEEQAILEDVI